MSRRLLTGITTLAAILLIAGVASAKGEMGGGGGAANGFAGGIFIFDRDTPQLGVSFPAKMGIVGLGYEMTGKLGASPHWGWNASFGYGIGDLKEETSSAGTSSTDELSATHWEVRAGFDYWSDCCDQDWYCGPGFVYTSTKVTAKTTGSPDFDYEPVKVIGFEPRVGGQMKLGTNMRLFGTLSQLVGYASYDQTVSGVEDKVNGWFTSTSWHGGLRLMY